MQIKTSGERRRSPNAPWRIGLGFLVILMLPCGASFGQDAADEATLWQALRDGTHAAIVRHALAPGIGDPDAFDIDDCTTQRNLSDAGRAQARRLGERFRQNGIDMASVYTSAWCRCVETAELLGLGAVENLPPLNSFFRNFERSAPQTEALNRWLADRGPGQPLVMVTHQVNISALVGAGVTSGEMVIFRQDPAGGIEVLGRITTPYPTE